MLVHCSFTHHTVTRPVFGAVDVRACGPAMEREDPTPAGVAGRGCQHLRPPSLSLLSCPASFPPVPEGSWRHPWCGFVGSCLLGLLTPWTVPRKETLAISQGLCVLCHEDRLGRPWVEGAGSGPRRLHPCPRLRVFWGVEGGTCLVLVCGGGCVAVWESGGRFTWVFPLLGKQNVYPKHSCKSCFRSRPIPPSREQTPWARTLHGARTQTAEATAQQYTG